MAFPVDLAEKKIELNSTFSQDQTDKKTFLWERKIIKVRTPTWLSFRSHSYSQMNQWKTTFRKYLFIYLFILYYILFIFIYL